MVSDLSFGKDFQLRLVSLLNFASSIKESYQYKCSKNTQSVKNYQRYFRNLLPNRKENILKLINN